MICLGYSSTEKDALIQQYCGAHDIRKVFVISPKRFQFYCSWPAVEHIEWAEVILYRFFYRLLQEIDATSLVVINECLRTQNRYDLTYNCTRQYLNQARHQIVFQYLPIIDTIEDFTILFDFDTRSRWKRERFENLDLAEARICSHPVRLELFADPVATSPRLQAEYSIEKRRLIDGIGLKDPHTIPRNLLLMAGKAKLASVDPGAQYVGRNNRLKLPNLVSYKEPAYDGDPYGVFEFCHDFINFSDFLYLSRQSRFEALVTDLKVDRWYFDRFVTWGKRLNDAYAAIR